MELTPYHAKYLAYELTKRSASDDIGKLAQSLVDAQVDLNPHQVDAALFAFKSPFSKGALLADEVGLGKTIEAGIVIAQKWAERKRRILIIAPANLRKQWSQELSDKFYLPSKIMESAIFNRERKAGNPNPFLSDEIVICSYQFARAKELFLGQISWDLAVIDEAHRLRNVYKPQNKIANSIKASLANSPKLLLTATPLQNSLLELYGLVSIIDDFTFGDLESYKDQFIRLNSDVRYADLRERLQLVCRRTLRRQVLEYIRYTNRIAITQEFFPYEDEQNLYDEVSAYLQRLSIYALPASQRHLMTLILRKLLASSSFAIAKTLDGLAEKLQSIVSASELEQSVLDAIGEDYEELSEVAEEWGNEDRDENEVEGALSEGDLAHIKAEIEDLRSYAQLAKGINQNAKGDVLLSALDRGFAEIERLGASRKALIFTESTRTQQYLLQLLEQSQYKGQVVLFNGSNADATSKTIYKRWLEANKGTDRVTGSRTADIRSALVEYFRDEATIMIATEAAAEGINLQFCSLVVNYDLPWNPQRIEQRIGRCHRYGQLYDVVVVNFLNKSNAADQRVYELLDQKFKLFSGVFGASDEILGSIESGVDFEKRIVEIYQNCRTANEIQESFDLLQAELEEQINDRMRHTRQQLLENVDQEVIEKLRFSHEKSRVCLNRYENWLWCLTCHALAGHAEFGEFSFTLKTSPYVGLDVPLGRYHMKNAPGRSMIYRLGHPLAQRILTESKSAALPPVNLTFQYSGIPKISILEPLIGSSGWLTMLNLTIEAFEAEDQILMAAVTDQGQVLDPETIQRLFSLPGTCGQAAPPMPAKLNTRLNEMLHAQEIETLALVGARNMAFFDAEMEKLDKWAEDRKNSLELELKLLDRDIKAAKTESKKILNLADKLKEQRRIKEMEKRRNELRMNLYQAQDEVDEHKENLIAEIEARLSQKIERVELFTLRWSIA